ncbi:MAG: hypothetical protein ABIH46_14200, partial [Chloroflexota bacterium]
VRLQDGEGERLKELAEAGCDFMVVGSAKGTWRLLKESRLGRILVVDPDLSDTLIRAASMLSLDVVLVECEGWDDPALSIERQMVFQRLIGLVRKPVLAVLPPGLSASDIEGLWEVGLTGLITGETARLSEFRDAIASLPATPRKSRGERISALIPRIIEQAGAPEVGEEEEEDEEDRLR